MDTPQIKPSAFDIPKWVLDTWMKIPDSIDLSMFLDGRQFMNPESIPEMKKVIMEFELNGFKMVCKNCKTTFSKNAMIHDFCSEKCRLESMK